MSDTASIAHRERAGVSESAQPSLSATSVDALLDALASDEPLPASGTAAALVAAMAAGLVSKVARVSREWEDGQGVAAQARALRVRLALLATADTEAYGAALAAMRLPRRLPQEQRDAILGRSLERAADVPLAIADAAADVAELAAAAAADLTLFGADFKGAKNAQGQVTPNLLFRGLTAGDKAGPLMSQFWYQPCFFGANEINQKIRTVKTVADGCANYMTDFNSWLAVQNGVNPTQTDIFDPLARYMRNGRDLGVPMALLPARDRSDDPDGDGAPADLHRRVLQRLPAERCRR